MLRKSHQLLRTLSSQHAPYQAVWRGSRLRAQIASVYTYTHPSSSSANETAVLAERHYDCTGRLVRCGAANLDEINHIIHNAIAGNEKYDHFYQEHWIMIRQSGVLSSLALIDCSRMSTPLTEEQKVELRHVLCDVQQSLEYDTRERYLAAAALQWDNGNFAAAAVLLENLLAKQGSDILISKLAQEAYILSGDYESALGCLVRHPATFNTAELFSGTVIGMMTYGYLENQRLSEAEESAKRAVAISSGRDLLSLSALLDAYYLSGKSSDMIEALSEYEVIHGAGLGKYVLLTKKGFAHVMRGNCNGAFKALVQMLETNPSKYFTPLSLERIPLPVIMDSALLLWQIIINLDTRHIMALDEATTPLWTCMTHMSDNHPAKQLIQAILLSSSLHALESKNCSEYMNERKESVEKQSKKRWNPMNLFSDDSPVSTTTNSSEDSIPLEYDEETKQRILNTKESLHNLLKELNDKLNSLSKNNSDVHIPFAVDFPFLYQVKSGDNYHRKEAIFRASKALIFFGLKDYKACVMELVSIHRGGYRALGMSATQRDVFWQTFIEALFRDNQLTSAGMLLSERTVLVPNDGQTWKRLAMIHRARGEEKMAEEAQYTAWQLGIGQGGFGGAI